MSSSVDIITKYSQDLEHVDVSLISKEFDLLDEIQDYQQRCDQLAELCAYKTVEHPQWSLLAGRIKMLSLKCQTGNSLSDTAKKAKILLHTSYYDFVQQNAETLDDMIIQDRDLNFDWFGISTAMKSYLLKVKPDKQELDALVVETPQQMFLRVAIWLHMPHDGSPPTRQHFDKIRTTYDDLSLFNYMHATPTLFNSGLRRPQLSSCFLMTIGDSMEHISKAWHDVAMISKNCGGIGCDIGDIRHSLINNSNSSSGIVPMLRVFNTILTYIDQGGKRKGSGAFYLPVYHPDIFEFLELKKNSGSEKMRARDLFYALWVPDLFMERVEKDEMWSLFCPNIAKGLNDVYGSEFQKLYEKYESQELYKQQVRARDLWQAIYLSWVEVGMPYVLFKDAVNRKSNQKNLGTIKCSNLCTEIVQYTSEKEIASCNLANIVLSSCVKHIRMTNKPVFDFSKLERLTRALVRNINNVIDINYYSDDVPQIKYANLRHRPMSIGVQALADTFAMMDYSWHSKEAYDLNNQIFETIYYAAVTESIKIARELLVEKKRKINHLENECKYLIDNRNGIIRQNNITDDQLEDKLAALLYEIRQVEQMETHYQTFAGSPASKGLLQFDLWVAEDIYKKSEGTLRFGEIEENYFSTYYDPENYKFLSGRYNWDQVRKDLKTYGMRNSLLVGLMPTASTAHLIGNNECFEPFTEMIYARTVLSGQFMLVNNHMVNDFVAMGIWSKKLAYDIIESGTLQNLNIENYIQDPSQYQIERFDFLKQKYLTSYELPQQVPVKMHLDRSKYVCQTSSFNVFMKKPTYQKMTSLMFDQWRNGAKTGLYYLRSAPASNAIKYATASTSTLQPTDKKELQKQYLCTEEVCLVCQ